jgi:hypothetical protein
MKFNTLFITILILIIILILIVCPAYITLSALTGFIIGIITFYSKSEFMSSDSKVESTIETTDNTSDDTPGTPVHVDQVAPIDYGDLLDEIMAGNDNQISDGDELLFNKNIDQANKSKQSIINRTRFNSTNQSKYFEEELNEQEKRHWFETDNAEMTL